MIRALRIVLRQLRLFERKPQHESVYVSRPGNASQYRLQADLDGVPWYSAPIPPRRHQCWPQTKGYAVSARRVWRCACGSASFDEGRTWVSRNKHRRRWWWL